LAGVGVMFIRVFWIPLYRDKETARFVETSRSRRSRWTSCTTMGKATRSWTIADQQAISRLRFRAADGADGSGGTAGVVGREVPAPHPALGFPGRRV